MLRSPESDVTPTFKNLTMPTILKNAVDAIAAVKKLREKSISYAIIDAAKGGTFDNCVFVGFSTDSAKLVFEKSSTQFEISPFAFCQRKETNVAQAPTYEFGEGAMTGTPVGLDPVVTVVQWFFALPQGQLLKFRASRPKTISVWNRTKGTWELRPNTTDLVVELVATPATPATPPTFPF